MTTYNKIAEQIQRLYARGYDRENLMPNIDKREIRLLAVQAINDLLSAELKSAQRIGDVNIMSSVIATYQGQAVSYVSPQYNLTSGATTAYNLTSGSTYAYTFTGASTVNLSNTVNYSTATGNVSIGDTVTGTGIPAGATITALLGPTQFQISLAATATNSGLLLNAFNNTITYNSNTTLKIGDSVSGTGLSAGSVVTAVLSSTSATLSLNCTASVTGQVFSVLSNTIRYAANIALAVGDSVSGTGIASGSTVTAIIGTTSATLSLNCTSGTTGQVFVVSPFHPSSFPVYTAKLPVFPLRLPFDMGVWGVYVEPWQVQCIPVTTSMNDLIGNLDEGLFENQIGYTVEGRNIKFIGSYTLLQSAFNSSAPYNSVTIKLLVLDPQLLNDDDPLPLPPEYEGTVIKAVLATLMAVPMAEKPNG